MTASYHLSIAIIGTGPSGLYTLHALLAATQPLKLTLYERSPVAGTGLPYSPLMNSVDMLANISSLEIPPLGITFAEWLIAQNHETLNSLGVTGEIDERAFYPRIALGAYFKSRFEEIVCCARAAGHQVNVQTDTSVDDIRPGISTTEVVSHNVDDEVAISKVPRCFTEFVWMRTDQLPLSWMCRIGIAAPVAT